MFAHHYSLLLKNETQALINELFENILVSDETNSLLKALALSTIKKHFEILGIY